MRVCICEYTCMYICIDTIIDTLRKYIHMGWLRSVGSIKLYVSFAKCRLFYRSLLQKRPIILSILLTKATPYTHAWVARVHTYRASVHIHIHARVSRMTWYVWVTCQTRMRHVTHMKESYRTYKEVMSHGSTNSTHIWMRHIIVSTSHVTRTNHSVSHLSRCIPITTVMNDFSHVTHATVGVSQQYRVRPL